MKENTLQYCWGFFPFGISLFHSQQNTRTAYFYIVIHLNQFLLGLHDPNNRKHHTRIVLFMHDTDLIFMLSFNLIFSVDSSDRLFYLETAGELPCTWCNLILKQTGEKVQNHFCLRQPDVSRVLSSCNCYSKKKF